MWSQNSHSICNGEDPYGVDYVAEAILSKINYYRAKHRVANLTLANSNRTKIAQDHACKLTQASSMSGLSVKNSAVSSGSESLGNDLCSLAPIDTFSYTWSSSSNFFIY
jgi:hypothetical protein